MRATFAWSPSETSRVRPSLRFTFGDFEVRMCRVFVWPRLILPVLVFLKRLAAPEWVFNLGILFLVSEGWVHLKTIAKTGISLLYCDLNQYIVNPAPI